MAMVGAFDGEPPSVAIVLTYMQRRQRIPLRVIIERAMDVLYPDTARMYLFRFADWLETVDWQPGQQLDFFGRLDFARATLAAKAYFLTWEKRCEIETLYRCVHPFFGSAFESRQWTPEEAQAALEAYQSWASTLEPKPWHEQPLLPLDFIPAEYLNAVDFTLKLRLRVRELYGSKP